MDLDTIAEVVLEANPDPKAAVKRIAAVGALFHARCMKAKAEIERYRLSARIELERAGEAEHRAQHLERSLADLTEWTLVLERFIGPDDAAALRRKFFEREPSRDGLKSGIDPSRTKPKLKPQEPPMEDILAAIRGALGGMG